MRAACRRSLSAGLALFLIATACADSTGPGPGPGPGTNVNEFLLSLPGWAAFSPTRPSEPPTPESAPRDTVEIVDVRQVEEDGSVTLIPDVHHACTTTRYTMTENPEKIVMYSPDKDLLWPGALIQGRSHRDGLGSLLGLTIAERTPIRVSIPSLANQDNFREVDNPGQATVSQAIGSMIGNATAAGLATPSTITFEQRVFHSEKEWALSGRVSGNYMGFSASATGDASRSAGETTVTAHFYQRMYEVVVAPPQTPSSFFSSDFTPAKLQEQQQLNRIGPDNIPVYLSNIVYGRMMMFSFTSTASEEEIRGTISVAYNGIGGSAAAELTARQRTILRESKIAVTSLGGPAEATLEVIRSGDWTRYFTDSAPLSTAEPLTYTFRSLTDGSIASVTETTKYDLKQCTAIAATPGAFQFLDLQSATLQIPTPARSLVGDIDGDGRTDLIWNHAGAGGNRIVVGLAVGDGTFTYTTPAAHPETPLEGWGNYTTHVGDVDGDDRADLVWSHLGTANKTYIAFSNGDGSFAFPSVRTHPTDGWTNYRAHVADVTGDGRDDVVWNNLTGMNRTYVGASLGRTGFDFSAAFTGPGSSWGPYMAFIGNVDANNAADIIWNSNVAPNRTYFGRSTGSSFTLNGPLDNTRVSNWSGFTRLHGDVNGDNRTDMVWPDTASNPGRIAVGLSTGTALNFLPLQTTPYDVDVPMRAQLGDVNGDGREDVIWNTSGSVNRSFASLGTQSGAFDFSPLGQLHPANGVNWDQFTMLIGDVNGDGRDDVVWNHAATTNRTYVGLAKP
jgi:hypothetical protein